MSNTASEISVDTAEAEEIAIGLVEALRHNDSHDKLLAKWSFSIVDGTGPEQPRTVMIYRLALATAFDDLLEYLEGIITPSNMPAMPSPGFLDLLLSWTARISEIYTQISFSRQFPTDKIRRFLDVSLTLLLFVTTCSHPSLVYRFGDLQDACLVMAAPFCTLWRRFPDVKLDLDLPMWVYAEMAPSYGCKVDTKSNVLNRHVQLRHELFKANGQRCRPHYVASTMLCAVADSSFLYQDTTSTLRDRLDKVGHTGVSRKLRALKLEVCVECGSSRLLGADSIAEYKACSACGFAMYCSISCQKKNWQSSHKRESGKAVVRDVTEHL